eukprot:gene2528-1583_t
MLWATNAFDAAWDWIDVRLLIDVMLDFVYLCLCSYIWYILYKLFTLYDTFVGMLTTLFVIQQVFVLVGCFADFVLVAMLILFGLIIGGLCSVLLDLKVFGGLVDGALLMFIVLCLQIECCFRIESLHFLDLIFALFDFFGAYLFFVIILIALWIYNFIGFDYCGLLMGYFVVEFYLFYFVVY